MGETVILAIQPAYNYKTNKVDYAEVLIRQYRGITGVPNILKYVEDNSLEVQFDLDVLDETCRVLKEYNCRSIDYPIGVNVCSNTATIEGVADQIVDILNKYKIHKDSIVIEINEDTDFKNDGVLNNMQKLRDRGIKIAIDDFGVGKANLYSLLSNKIDILKIDKTFIDKNSTDIGMNECQYSILKTLLSMCDALHLSHVIEGIETNSQLDMIKELGYSVVQGYLYSKPEPYIEYMQRTCAS